MSLRLPEDEYKALCRKVLDRDNWKCRNPRCGMRNGLSVHHIIWRSEMGKDESWNLCALCTRCHDKIHTYDLFIYVGPDNHVGPGGGADGQLYFTRG